MMKLRQCVETWVPQENGHFSLNNGSNSSWIRNSAISYEKKNISLICIYKYPKMLPFTFQVKISKNMRWHIYCTLKYKSNILIKKKISGNLFVTISASARCICTRKCEQILCTDTFILFISTNGCLYNLFTHF